MLNENKLRPDDGSEDEQKIVEAEENRKQEKASEEAELEKFVKEAEEEYQRREEQKKEELERWKKRAGKKNNEEETESNDKNEKDKLIYGQKIQPQRKYEINKGFGIFDSSGKVRKFGTSNVARKMDKIIRRGARGISGEKINKWQEYLKEYHKTKRGNSSTFEAQEVKDFSAGMRRGGINARFRKFTNKLKEEGVIKQSADVRRLFTKTEIKKLGNPLLGESNKSYRLRGEKSEIVSRRMGSSDPKPMRKF